MKLTEQTKRFNEEANAFTDCMLKMAKENLCIDDITSMDVESLMMLKHCMGLMKESMNLLSAYAIYADELSKEVEENSIKLDRIIQMLDRADT